MHKIKNKKILASILAGTLFSGIITNTTLALENNSPRLEESDNDSSSGESSEPPIENTPEEEGKEDNEEESTLSSVSDINNDINIDKKCSISATIINIDNNVLSIKDSSGEGLIYLDFNLPSDMSIKQGDTVIATGTIKKINEKNYLTIDDLSNINIIKNETTETPDNNQDSNQNNTNNQNNVSNQNNANNSGGGGNNKPSQSVSQNQNNNVNNQNPNTNTNSNSIKTISARSYIYINYDLSSSQWDKVKEAIEEGKIKVADLKNNKIRIKKVSNGYGDIIWIINDPRGLDEETEDEVRTIGLKLAESINYEDYNVTKSKWNTILKDIQEGIAKIKETSDGDLKIIYQKSNKTDSTITIEKNN